jgi:hypothetical protein
MSDKAIEVDAVLCDVVMRAFLKREIDIKEILIAIVRVAVAASKDSDKFACRKLLIACPIEVVCFHNVRSSNRSFCLSVFHEWCSLERSYLEFGMECSVIIL